MAREYNVHSEKLREFLSDIADDSLKERYELFFSDHENVHYRYCTNNTEQISELRRAAEALCKLIIFVYIPNAEELFKDKDNLSHTYLKVIKNRNSDAYNSIEEKPLGTMGTKGEYWYDGTNFGQLAYALIYKRQEKEDGKNMIYNKIKECYNNLYEPLNTDASHSVPSYKQSSYGGPTLFSYYFGWVHSMIDLCSDKLSKLAELLPWENTPIEENVKNEIELEQLISEDESLKELNGLEGDFKPEIRKTYMLRGSATLSPQLNASMARIGWNMVIDFDSKTQEIGGLFNTIKNIWEGKRQMLYSEVETNGDKITYWVQANGNIPENQPKEWRRTYLPTIEEKIKKLSSQKPEGEIVIVDLYSQSIFPEMLYKRLPWNMRVIRLLSSKEDMISDTTKEYDIDAEIREYVVDQIQLARYLGSLNSNVLGNSSNFTSGCSEITVEDVNKLAAYGIECVPEIPLSQEKKDLDVGFCSGNRITWNELYADIDIKRNGYDNYYKNIADYVKRGENFVGYISHSPCSGGTTVARRLAYDLMNKDAHISGKCYVIFLSELKSLSIEIFQQIRILVEDKLPSSKMLIIFIDRTISDDKVEELRKSYIKPTHNVSIVRVKYNYDSIPKEMRLTIKESLMPDERPNFNRLYEKRRTGISGMGLENVIDYPLSLKNFNNTQSVNDYLQEWMKKIDLKYQNSIQRFSILVSVASLYVYDYDRYVSTGFTDTVFNGLEKKNIWEVFYLMTKSSQDAFKKLFDIEKNDEGKQTGRIRPRFSLFARSIIENSHMGIYDIAHDYLEHVSKWNDSDKMKYVRDVFLKRPDFETDESQSQISLNDKISSFFKDNKSDSESILEVYKLLISYFGNDENCLLSYSQFLYNKAYYEDKESHDGKSFTESENKLLSLLEKINEKPFDSLVYQSLGVLYYRKIGVLRYLFMSNSNAFMPDHYKCILRYRNICSENCDMSTDADPTSAYGLVTKAQMLKSVLNITKNYKQYEDWTFCETEKIYQDMYLDYLEACSKIAKHIPAEEVKDTRTNSDYMLINRFNELDDFRKKLNGGVGKDFFAKYDKKWESAKDEKLKIIYGCRLYDTVISSKRKDIRACISKFDDTYISRIEEVTRYNARKGVSGSYEKLLNLIIFNSRTNCNIQNAIELVKEWERHAKSNEEHLWINYYFMVFYAVQILNEGHANEGLMNRYNEVCRKTKRYCDEADQKEYDTYAYLYYKASEQGLSCITEDKSNIIEDKANFVQGTIIDVSKSNRRRGKTKLDCGLEASFAAKDKKFDDADVNITRLEGIIGFRFNGLGLYKQDIIMDMTDEKAEEVSIQTEDFIETNKKENESYDNNDTTTVSVKPNIVGYVDLSTIKDKKRLVTANSRTKINQAKEQEYGGVIVLEGRNKKIKCDSFPYSLPIEGCDPNEFYEDEEVTFVVKSRPQDKNQLKPYYFATNLRLKED